MQQAFHPYRDIEISVEQYIAEFGNRLDAFGRRTNRPAPRCPVCGNNMHIRGEADPGVVAIFSHQPNITEFCPLKESAAKSYKILPPRNENLLKTERLRASFFENWKLHWSLMRSYVPYLDIFDFIKLIQYADKNRIWSYRNIVEAEIPYIFLVLKEFPPVKNEKKYLRIDWLRFWFDSRIRNINDLWIQTNGDWRIIKAFYANPRKKGIKPGSRQLKKANVLPVNLDFLSQPEPALNNFLSKQMEFLSKQMKKSFEAELGEGILK